MSSAGPKTGKPWAGTREQHKMSINGKGCVPLALTSSFRCCIWYVGYVQLAVCRFSKLGEHAKFPQDECERWETDFQASIPHSSLKFTTHKLEEKGILKYIVGYKRSMWHGCVCQGLRTVFYKLFLHGRSATDMEHFPLCCLWGNQVVLLTFWKSASGNRVIS